LFSPLFTLYLRICSYIRLYSHSLALAVAATFCSFNSSTPSPACCVCVSNPPSPTSRLFFLYCAHTTHTRATYCFLEGKKKFLYYIQRIYR
jgi:hypothetical protein